ncbi:hypothetical protein QFC22_004743 [Naganishia vaughanmartiniae]|uniref:Uncharacterized protein n=1 Tax=Naganishia vaughanmartiniae TaxID=1424756 RepID=A0ACC2WX15_9TREE|nr:hypothetical protein QFC22_004743 [Naganishia vaughanmartiniae]
MDLEIDEELNFLRRSDFEGPNGQNLSWARQLAERRLARATFPSFSLELETCTPYVISTSLPATYTKARFLCSTERSSVASAQAFERLVELINPKGWKYVKFLFVTKVSLPMPRIHLRRQTQSLSSATAELSNYFPRLLPLGLMNVVPHSTSAGRDYAIHLALYKPMQLSSLLRACIPYGFGGRGITFFGTHYHQNTAAGPVENVQYHFCDIVRLDIRPGAHIIRERRWAATDMQECNAIVNAMKYGDNYKLSIGGAVDAVGVERTLRTVIDLLALQASWKTFSKTGKEVNFRLECSQSVFENSIEHFESRQPCFFRLLGHLTNSVTKLAMKGYLSALSDIYQQHWRHQAPNAEGSVFMQIVARTPKIPRKSNVARFCM